MRPSFVERRGGDQLRPIKSSMPFCKVLTSSVLLRGKNTCVWETWTEDEGSDNGKTL